MKTTAVILFVLLSCGTAAGQCNYTTGNTVYGGGTKVLNSCERRNIAIGISAAAVVATVTLIVHGRRKAAKVRKAVRQCGTGKNDFEVERLYCDGNPLHSGGTAGTPRPSARS